MFVDFICCISLEKNKRNLKRTAKKSLLNMLDILEYYSSFYLNVRFALLSFACVVFFCFILMLFGIILMI